MLRKILSIQVLRALAASMVAFHHVWKVSCFGEASAITASQPFGNMAGFGVYVFFVISGFLMVVTLKKGVDHAPLAGAFITSRLERIYPIYMLCVLAVFGGAYLASAIGVFFKPDVLALTPAHFVGNLLLLPALPGQTDYQMALPQAWTLVYEMYFYVLFALCLLVGGRRWIVASLSLVLGGLFLISQFGVGQGERDHWINLRYLMGDPQVLTFLLGAVIGGAYQKGWMPEASARLKPLILVAGLVLTAIAVTAPEGAMSFVSIGLPAVGVVALAAIYTLPENRVTKPMVYLGEASYSIYLVHIFVAFVAYRIAHAVSFPPDLEGVVLSLVGIALGCASYSLVERPIMLFFKQRRAARAVAAQPA